MKNLARSIVALFICSIIFSTTAYASSRTDDSKSTQTETLGVSDFFVNFTDKALSNLDTLSIADSNGNDVTKKYVKRFTEYYSLNDYKSIQELIKNDGLLVSYKIREVDTHLAADTGGYFGNKEWLSTVSGTAEYDPNTGKIISASSPTLNVDANFGAAFSVTLKNISTGRTINTSSIEYYGSYSMTATLGIPIGNFQIGFPLDYGSYNDKFTAYPQF